MRWLVADSLYRPEAFFASHLDSYTHYLREFGEDAKSMCLNWGGVGVDVGEGDRIPFADIVFVLDGYERFATMAPAVLNGTTKVAQVAAVCDPMPWDVRGGDGKCIFSCVISSIPWMVQAARDAGVRGEYIPLAFDTRARVAGMGVKRDLGCIFIGTTGGNHVRRTQLLAELADVVTVMPPVFGRDYFRTLARAKLVLSPHAEWALGALNNMRMFEAAGMGAIPLAEGQWPAEVEPFGYEFSGKADAYALISDLLRSPVADNSEAVVLRSHTYESRIPQLVEIARSL